MCGIVAYTGARHAQPILLESLARLEYRGYDSAGIALQQASGLNVMKKAGRIARLATLCESHEGEETTGISHTRWATHGEANDTNAHPHLDQSGKLALVHNGVVDNYLPLREMLKKLGHTFHSQTDTEVLAHLIGHCYEQSSEQGNERLIDAVDQALQEIEGTYGIALVHTDHPGVIVGARKGSPLVLGLGNQENFLSSDANSLVGYTSRVIFLKDDDIVCLTPGEFDITSRHSKTATVEIHDIEHSTQDMDKGIYPHYMLKEIFEQPRSIENAYRGRIDHAESSAKLGGLNMTPQDLREISGINILACGTALHAGMIGEHTIEELAHIPVEAHFASEFRYRNCPINRNTLFFAVSQSGETADTLGAMREARRKGFRCLGICNTVGSTIARESDGGVYMHAGPEVGVAATKSFTSQVVIFQLLALLLGRMSYLSPVQGDEIIEAIELLPHQVQSILDRSGEIQAIAQRYAESKSMLFLGRKFNYPVALEAALKMKEISYIHAEGYPSSELKHGVIALVESNTPSVFIIPQDSLYEKNLNNLQEVKARKGPVIAVANEEDDKIGQMADAVIRVPKTMETLQPILNIVPLQLLSYYTALYLKRDIDKPRNLAKSVTVE